MKIPHNAQTERVINNQSISAKDAARAARKAQSKAAYNSKSNMEEFININSEIRNKIFQTTHAKPQRTRKAQKGVVRDFTNRESSNDKWRF